MFQEQPNGALCEVDGVQFAPDETPKHIVKLCKCLVLSCSKICNSFCDIHYDTKEETSFPDRNMAETRQRTLRNIKIYK